MAGSARLALMGALQQVARFRMIECNFTPPFAGMAVFTGCPGVVFFIQESLMCIGMAIDATSADLPEAPCFILLMA